MLVKICGGIVPGGKFLGGIFPGGKFPRIENINTNNKFEHIKSHLNRFQLTGGAERDRGENVEIGSFS